MNTQFDNETTPHQQQDGSWSLTLSDQWNIGENPNGGYLIIPALRAMQEREEHPDPLSVTAHFLRPGTGDAPAQINTDFNKSNPMQLLYVSPVYPYKHHKLLVEAIEIFFSNLTIFIIVSNI